MNFDFTIERDYETKPYSWQTWENGRVVKSEPAEILAFYKVFLNRDKSKWYIFEIRNDRVEAGNIVYDHDDTLTEYLFQQKVGLKEVNALVQKIFDAMGKDYFEQGENK